MKELLSRLVRFMTLNLHTWREKTLPNLLDSTEKIKAVTFFKVMETNNLSLLNPTKKRVSPQVLNEAWAKLREEYYKESDPRAYREDLKKAKRIECLKIEIAGCYAAVNYFELTGEILPCFKDFGYTVENAKDVARVAQKMKSRQTKLTLLTPSAKEQDKKEAVKFWEMAADLESALNQLNVLHGKIDAQTILLVEWINYIKSIKKADGQNRKK